MSEKISLDSSELSNKNTSEKWDVERTFLFDWRRENH